MSPSPPWWWLQPRPTPDRRDNENVTPSSLQYYFCQMRHGPGRRRESLLPASALFCTGCRRADSKGRPPLALALLFLTSYSGTLLNLMTGRHRTPGTEHPLLLFQLVAQDHRMVPGWPPSPESFPKSQFKERKENPLPGFSSHPCTPPALRSCNQY